jgi:hypothetical protein
MCFSNRSKRLCIKQLCDSKLNYLCFVVPLAKAQIIISNTCLPTPHNGNNNNYNNQQPTTTTTTTTTNYNQLQPTTTNNQPTTNQQPKTNNTALWNSREIARSMGTRTKQRTFETEEAAAHKKPTQKSLQKYKVSSSSSKA